MMKTALCTGRVTDGEIVITPSDELIFRLDLQLHRLHCKAALACYMMTAENIDLSPFEDEINGTNSAIAESMAEWHMMTGEKWEPKLPSSTNYKHLERLLGDWYKLNGGPPGVRVYDVFEVMGVM